MGCSSSAQTRVKDCNLPAPTSNGSDANGLLQKGDENETVPDQTKLGAMEEVDLGSDGTKLSENVAKEEVDVLVPGITQCALSTCQRVDPEGTEPQSVAPEEKLRMSEPLPLDIVEASQPLPVEPTDDGDPRPAAEATHTLPPEIAQNGVPEPTKLAEESTTESAGTAEINPTLVTEIVKELQMDEEEQIIEGETGEKVETEMRHEIVSEVSETKEEEMGEATAATQMEATDKEE